MNRDDVIDVLSVVAAATRRTVGEADVTIWTEIIGDDDKQLALKAVRDHLAEQPGTWLEPGHVHQRVRAIMRDQIEREPDELRSRRQEQLAAKVREDAAQLADQKTASVDAPMKYRRPSEHQRQLLAVRCSWCHAAPGSRCVNHSTGRTRDKAHPSRYEASGLDEFAAETTHWTPQ